MQKGGGEIGIPNVRGNRSCHQECQFFNDDLEQKIPWTLHSFFLPGGSRANLAPDVGLESQRSLATGHLSSPPFIQGYMYSVSSI